MTETLDVTLKGFKYGTKFIDDKGFKYTLLEGYSQPFLAGGHYDGEVGSAEGLGKDVWNKIAIPGLRPYVEKKEEECKHEQTYIVSWDHKTDSAIIACKACSAKIQPKKTVRMAQAFIKGQINRDLSWYESEEQIKQYWGSTPFQWPVKYDIEHFMKTGELFCIVGGEE